LAGPELDDQVEIKLRSNTIGYLVPGLIDDIVDLHRSDAVSDCGEQL
jgi:hypothetical protein